jgi:LPXTG-motif cell wall-anchored protein
VIEKPIPGYQTKYVNVGVYAHVTDRCCDGGTIINKKIPKTGDTADFALWAGIIALGVVGLTATVILTKRKRANK